MKKIYYKLLITASLFGTAGCEKMQFDDPVSFTIEEAKALTPDYYFKLTTASFASSIFYSFDGPSSTAGFSILADQTTTTNRNLEWWDFAKEPRIPLNPSESYGGRDVLYVPYYYFYQANLNATLALEGLYAGNPGIDANGNDRTNEVYAIAHFIKGVSQGYLGATYDRGVIVDKNLGGSGLQEYPNSYKELIENGVAHFDSAIVYANKASSITLSDFYVNVIGNKTTLIQFANSLAARFLASIPRDKTEAKALGAAFWNKVLTYAQNGLTTDLTTAGYGGSGHFYNYSARQLYTLINSNTAAYLPIDIKLAHFADNTGTYPDSYPTNSTTVLDAIQTDDARFHQYYRYFPAFGFLLEERGRHLFSNYGRVRRGFGANPVTYDNRQVVFVAEELRLLRAEAKFWLDDFAGAAAELNASTARRKAIGGLRDVPATEAALRYVLHYEWAVEIDVEGGNLGPFAFMRRHNLLQPGTPTQFPIVENQLKLTPNQLYTFGGEANIGVKGIWGETGTAGADWGWKGTKVNY